MDSNKNCGKSSAKSLKGFTLIELLIVMAILSILAGMSSLVISGFVRDAKLETARTTAQEVYTGIQNALVQIEIKQEDNLLMPKTYNTSATDSSYITMTLVMDGGNIGKKGLTLDSGKANGSVSIDYSYPNAAAAADDTERAFRKLAKYLTDNLAMDFTGYVYAAIDMEDWMVDSVVYVEDYEKVNNSTNKIKDFIPYYKTKTSNALDSNGRIPFCDDIFQQKKIYKGEEPAILSAGGTAVGYYPFLNDLTGTTVSYT